MKPGRAVQLLAFLVALAAGTAWCWAAGTDGASVLSLGQAVEKALARDSLVQEARQALESARAGAAIARSHTPRLTASSSASSATTGSLDPQSVISGTSYSSQSYRTGIEWPMAFGTNLSLSTSASTSTTNSTLRAGGGKSFTFANAALGLNVSRPLSLVRDERVLTEGSRWSAEIAVRSAELALESARREVVAQSADRFFAALRAQRQAEIAAAFLGQAEELLRITRERLRLGKVAEVDVAEVQASADRARADLRRAESDVATALDALKNYLGLPLEQELRVRYEGSPVSSRAALNEAELIARALSHRPDVRQQAFNIRLADLSLRQASAEARPAVALSAGYSRSGQGEDLGASFRQLTNRGWFVGLSSGMSLSHAADQASIDQARGALRLAQVQDQLGRDEVRLQVRRLLRDVQNTAANADLLAQVVKSAEESLRVRRVQFERGLITAFDVMQRETELARIRAGHADALVAYHLAQIQLTLAVGEMPQFAESEP